MGDKGKYVVRYGIAYIIFLTIIVFLEKRLDWFGQMQVAYYFIIFQWLALGLGTVAIVSRIIIGLENVKPFYMATGTLCVFLFLIMWTLYLDHLMNLPTVIRMSIFHFAIAAWIFVDGFVISVIKE